MSDGRPGGGDGHPLPTGAEARRNEVPEELEKHKAADGEIAEASAATILVNPDGSTYPEGDLGPAGDLGRGSADRQDT